MWDARNYDPTKSDARNYDPKAQFLLINVSFIILI